MSTSQAPIILRAKITEDEWAEIRKQAIDAGVRPSELVGRTLRSFLLTPKEKTA